MCRPHLLWFCRKTLIHSSGTFGSYETFRSYSSLVDDDRHYLIQPSYAWNTLQVGVSADSASKGSTGLSVAIRTNIYPAKESELDYFWMSTDLSNGAFVQFGYSLEPGNYCLKGEAISGNII